MIEMHYRSRSLSKAVPRKTQSVCQILFRLSLVRDPPEMTFGVRPHAGHCYHSVVSAGSQSLGVQFACLRMAVL